MATDDITSATALEMAARAGRQAAFYRSCKMQDRVERYETEQREWERKAKAWKAEEADARVSRRRGARRS